MCTDKFFVSRPSHAVVAGRFINHRAFCFISSCFSSAFSFLEVPLAHLIASVPQQGGLEWGLPSYSRQQTNDFCGWQQSCKILKWELWHLSEIITLLYGYSTSREENILFPTRHYTDRCEKIRSDSQEQEQCQWDSATTLPCWSGVRQLSDQVDCLHREKGCTLNSAKFVPLRSIQMHMLDNRWRKVCNVINVVMDTSSRICETPQNVSSTDKMSL